MSEVKCYSLDIPIDEFFDGMSAVPNESKMRLPIECKGYLGVNIDYRNGIAHHLYDTPKHRNKAYEKVKRQLVCFINMQTAYVDKKYLKGLN